MKTITAFFLVTFFLLTGGQLFSQTDGKITTPKTVSSDVENLYHLQDQAKMNGNLNDILSIQKQINSMTGVVSQSTFEQDGYSIPNSSMLIQSDNININTVVTSGFVKALATCTESRGANIGRIWMAVGYTGPGAGGDTIAYFKSDDGGITFTLAATVVFNANVKLKNDQLDMEIIENTTGDKFLWLVRGVTNTSTGIQYAGVTILNTTTNNTTSPVLTWPGGSAVGTNYYNPRITSDNEQYPSNPYVFISVALDSVVGTDHHLKIKYAQCNDPFTGQTINYNSASIAGTDILSYLPSFYQDIAYYNNGTDSLVVCNNNRTDSTYISFRTFRRADALTNIASLSFNLQPSPNNQTMFPRLASSGVNNIALVYRTNFLNSGDWDIRSYICKGGISLSSNWLGKPIDNDSDSLNAPGRADVIGVRFAEGSFRVSYVVSAATGSLWYANYNAASVNWQTAVEILTSGASVGSVPSVAGFRYVSGDSAFCGYSGFNGVNAYSVAGSSGTTIGINPISSNPVEFGLAQNYPNPFNPTTKIEFSIPEKGLVKLEVFDVAGRLVSLLANETMNAGKYQAEFNGAQLSSGVYFYKITAGSFVETKKMLLVK